MSAGWEIKTLSELCQLISGQHIDARNYNTERRGCGYLTGPSDFGPINPVVSKWTEFPKVKAQSGDILITVKGSGVGSTNLLDQHDIAISRQLMAVRVKGADPRFVHMFLASKFDYFQSLATGAAIPGLSRDQILGLEIKIPPLSEQKRIAAILDEAVEGIDRAVANAEKNLANARELFDGYLNSTFLEKGNSWKTARLRDVSLVFTDGDWIESKDQSSTGIRLIQTGNIGRGEFKDRAEKARYISKDTFYRLRCEEVLQGDCLISRLPDPVGRACIVPALEDQLITAVDCTIVRFDNQRIIAEYFKYFSQSATYLAHVEASCTGATRKRISRDKLGDIQLQIAPIADQERLVAEFEELSANTQRLEAIYRQKLIELSGLKQNLLQRAFAGELSTQSDASLPEAAE